MEERRSTHSLHGLRTSRSHPGPKPLSDISFIDEDVKTPSPDYPYDISGKNPKPRAHRATKTNTMIPLRFELDT